MSKMKSGFLLGTASGLFFFFSLLKQKVLLFWVSYEMGSLFLVPLFLTGGRKQGKLMSSLLLFIMMSGLGGSMLYFYFFKVSQEWILLMVLAMKLGVFPFNFWFFEMSKSVSWLVNYLILIVAKTPLFMFNFNFGLESAKSLFFVYLVLFSWLFNWFILLDNEPSLNLYFCSFILKSGYVYFVFLSQVKAFLVMILIATFVLKKSILLFQLKLFNARIKKSLVSKGGFLWLSLGLVIFPMPMTLGLFYKIVSSLGLMAKDWFFWFLLGWVMHKVLEFFYVFKLLLTFFKEYYYWVV